MIGSINSNTLNVMNGNTTATQYIDSNKLQQGVAGQVRHTGSRLEVYDGNQWQSVYTNYASVELPEHTQKILAWAERKMQLEIEAEQLSQTSAAVAGALEEYNAVIKLAQERLNLMVQLAREHA